MGEGNKFVVGLVTSFCGTCGENESMGVFFSVYLSYLLVVFSLVCRWCIGGISKSHIIFPVGGSPYA